MTNQIPQQIATIGIGVLLIIMGSLLIQRKRMKIPIGGMGCSRPLFSIPLIGIGAIIFGIVDVLIGVLIIGFVIFAFTQSDSRFWNNSIYLLQFFVIVGLLFGFGIGMVMQILMLFVNAAKKGNKGS